MKLDSIVFNCPTSYRGHLINSQTIVAQDLYDYISTHDIFTVHDHENNQSKTLHKVFLCTVECADQMFVLQKHTKCKKLKHIKKYADKISKVLNENIIILKAEHTDDGNAEISIIYETGYPDTDNTDNNDNSEDLSDEESDDE